MFDKETIQKLVELQKSQQVKPAQQKTSQQKPVEQKTAQQKPVQQAKPVPMNYSRWGNLDRETIQKLIEARQVEQKLEQKPVEQKLEQKPVEQAKIDQKALLEIRKKFSYRR